MSDIPEHVSNQILAMLKPNISDEDARSRVEEAGGKIIKTSSNGRLTSVLIEAANVKSTMAALEETGMFSAIQLNYISKHT